MAFVAKLAYEASAGSGKTFNLVVRYLSLLFMGADPKKVLALTFTNKAAAEMQERVIDTLQKLDKKFELEVIAEVTELPKSELLANRENILKTFLSSDAKIYTIDKFFAKILRKFSLHVGIMPDFSTFASQHELKLMARFLNEVVIEGIEKSLINLSLMSSKRLSDIFILLDEMYVKSKEMPSTWSYKKSDYRVFEVEALKALAELSLIVNSCKIASKSAKKAVNIEEFELLMKATWLQKESCSEYSYFKKCFTPEMDSALFKIQDAVFKRQRAYEENFFYELMRLLKVYVKSKEAIAKDDGELSFNDITSLVYKLLKADNSIDSDFLYFRLDSEIEHILLDEFQDTSILQYEILSPIIDEVTSGEGTFKNRSLFFVGDVKQSIYRFRGGVSALFSDVAKKYDVKVEPLVTNYRSDRAIVDFVNKTFEHKIKNYIPQKVKSDAGVGYTQIVKSDNVLEKMFEHVNELLTLGTNKNSIAVLTTTNGDGQSVADYLKIRGIDVVTETTSKLIAQKKVKALIEYFKYCYFQKEIYKQNYFALIYQEPTSLLCFDTKKYGLIEIAKKIVEKYKLFDGDMNIIRFMNLLSSFNDIEQLLFEYEQIDEVASQSDVEGVRILTIHKSKGLEFQHVTIIDRLKKAPPSRAPIIYEYSGIQLQNIYLRISARSSYDKAYEKALQKETILVREDTLNALYVAFTRAEKSLFIIEKTKDSYFGILSLEESSCGNLEIEKRFSKKITDKKNKDYREFYYGTQNNLLSLQQEKESDLEAIEFGNAMHYMLEMLYEFNQDSLANAFIVMKNRYSDKLDEKNLNEVCKRVDNLLVNRDFLSLVEGKVYKEQGIIVDKELRYLDVLVEKNDGSWIIIDYKSSMNYHEQHIAQVSFYRYALEKITASKVKSYLCYLLQDEIILKKV